MRVVLTHGSMGQILRWIQRILFAGGVLMLGYCGFNLLDAWNFQSAESRRLEQLMTLAASPEMSPPVTAGGLVGRIEIQRLGVSAIIM